MTEKRHSCLCRKEEPLQGYGVAAALCWSSGGTARQEASSLLAVSLCELLIDRGKQHSPLLSTYCSTWRCCVHLWGSCSGNGKFSRGQQPAEVSKMEPGFAEWSMTGRQKTPDINCKKGGSSWTGGKIC